jgi:hypothetical protein
MMIPDFDENGYLPTGIHPASVDEVARRFGKGSAVREAQAESLQWLLPLCRAAGVSRLVIDGSFVTDVVEPNDVDCLLLQGAAYNESSQAAGELEQGLPFLSLQIVRQAAFDYLAGSFFATDRCGIAKGIVEIIL